LRDRFTAWSPRYKSSADQERELFGSSSGKESSGCIERLDGGTLFLEDLEYLAANLQIRIARLLNRGKGRMENSRMDLPWLFRLVAATTQNPVALCRKGNIVPELANHFVRSRVNLPALRDRTEELVGMAWFWLEYAMANLPGITCRRFSTMAMEKLMEHAWPGNLPELRQCIVSACLNTQDEEILPGDVVFAEPLT
jgi:DNA-binding NtrC family response regulator